MSDFIKCTNISFNEGVWEVECKLGLWSVSGSDRDTVCREGKHYFEQYKEDGEYYEILGGLSPYEIIYGILDYRE